MIKKRLIKTLFVLLAVLLAAGCQDTDKKEEAKDQADGNKEVYQFVDVLGQQYEAELLEAVPKNTYDLKRIKKKDGYQHYTDEAGNIISKVGIDVSEYQPSVDWAKVKASGIDFAIIRVGFRGYGQEGKLVEDAMFKSHIEGALAAGLDVGVYFFSQAVDKEEAYEEAQFVLERIRPYAITYPVIFDTEEIKNDEARTDHLKKEQFTANCITFCDAVEEAGYETMIYANMKWMAFTLDLNELAGYKKWYADYEPLPQCPYEFSMWQYTEKGKVPGIEGNVDLNLCFDRFGSE